MAELTGKSIGELPNASTLSDEDLFAISSGASSKRVLWSTIKSALMSALGFVPLVQVLGMTDNTAQALINALNLANSSIPIGASILYVGNSGTGAVANRAMVLCSKVNNTLGRGLVISAYAINGTVLTLSSGTWSAS